MAKDFFHQIFKTGLEYEGWTVTHDPFSLDGNDPDWQIDLGAEFISESGRFSKIAVEVKGFLETSFSYEFHRAVGQYLNYKISMAVFDPERIMYLAVPYEVYLSHFFRTAIARSVQVFEVFLIIYDPATKAIIQWEPYPVK